MCGDQDSGGRRHGYGDSGGRDQGYGYNSIENRQEQEQVTPNLRPFFIHFFKGSTWALLPMLFVTSF